MPNSYDAVVVGAGPNGLAAAIALAREGLSVVVLEAQATIGGGTRSQELTEPGFIHDVCSAVHPMALASPFLKSLPLHEHGLAFVHPTLPLAHPLSDGRVATLERSLDNTAQALGVDAQSYRRLLKSFVENADTVVADLLGPLRVPKHPLLALRFGVRALAPTQYLANALFQSEEARALWAGVSAHSMLPLTRLASSATAMLLVTAGHAYGWPFVQGGSQNIANAMASYLHTLGGEIVTGVRVTSVKDIPPAKVVLFDLTPRQILAIEGLQLPDGYRRRLQRYRYGPGVFKIDWALKEAIPWRSQACRHAGTVHVGGNLAQIALSERSAWNGVVSEKPFVLVAQPSLFDSTRSPIGKHTAWAYCHVPRGSTVNQTAAIENQIEAYAPGFRECILARHTMNSHEFEVYNSNAVGGDILGGVTDLWQLFFRPVAALDPYRLPGGNYYICSSSTPPGPGVHGLCGYFAAQSALRRFGR